MTGYLVLAFYSVVGGWCVYYMVQAFLGNGIVNDPAMMSTVFGEFASSGVAPVIAHLAFLGATALVVLFGVEKGIERISKVLMPLLFIMMLILIARGLTLMVLGLVWNSSLNLISQTSRAKVCSMPWALLSFRSL